MNEQKKIGVDCAYRAMFRFLESYFERTRAEEIAALLGSMALADDGLPMDPAMRSDWHTAVQGAIRSNPENDGELR